MERKTIATSTKPPLVLSGPSRSIRIGALYAWVIMMGLMAALVVLLVDILELRDQKLSDLSRESFIISTVVFAGCCWLLWKSLAMRIYLFPYRFEVHDEGKICGYRWKNFWYRKRDLSKASAIVVKLSSTASACRWSLLVREAEGRKCRKVHESFRSFQNDFDASLYAMADAKKIANYLNLPLEYKGWSKKLVEFYAEHNRQLEIMQRNESYPSKLPPDWTSDSETGS